MSQALHKRSRKHPSAPQMALRLCFGSALAGLSATGWAQEAAAPPAPASDARLIQLAPIVVVGTTPLLGIGTPLEKVPANVQTIKGSAIEQQHSAVLTDYFERNVGSVDINEAQGNPSQTDINYRGFTASPLLGTPQGLSVFLDGVRINEPFGSAARPRPSR